MKFKRPTNNFSSSKPMGMIFHRLNIQRHLLQSSETLQGFSNLGLIMTKNYPLTTIN